jgi:hypothetical protein
MRVSIFRTGWRIRIMGLFRHQPSFATAQLQQRHIVASKFGVRDCGEIPELKFLLFAYL